MTAVMTTFFYPPENERVNVKEDVIENYLKDKMIDCSWDDVNDVLKDWDRVMQRAEEISTEIGFEFFFENPHCKELFSTLANVSDESLVQHEDFKNHSLAILKGIHSVMQNLSARYEEENEILPKSKTENRFKKLFQVKNPIRRSSLAEVREANAVLKNSPVEVKSQVTSPITLIRKQPISATTASPTPSDRRPSRAFLHPDHAKLVVKRSSLLTPPSQRFSLSFEDSHSTQNGPQASPLSSSAASSITSISNAPALESQHSDPLQNYEKRKSSTTTNKYFVLDAHDLEYSLIKAAARGSIGPCSLSQSLQRLTFTQSLAFPELAKGVSNKRKSSQNNTRDKLNPLDSGVNAFAKVATALLLVLISVLVFGVLYKFIRT